MSEQNQAPPFLSPSILTTLLKCHYGGFVESQENTNLEALKALGVIYNANGIPSTTPLGDAWVRAILKTNIPKAAFVFVNEHGEVV